MTEREIFFEALEMATPAARAAYLQGACGHDVALRRQVDKLLKEHFSNDSLLSGPAVEAEQRTIKFELAPAEALAQMLGRYKLLEKIGEGGFGEVWMAEQREPVKRRVALKLIRLGMDSRQIVARFEAERQALAMMDHANIAKIFDAGVTDTGRPYFVMELVRGIKITEYCDQNQLPTQERLRLFILVCQAIQHAHQKGIIHRDIKPSNILVTLHDGVPVPKVIDFGIAKATQQELTDKTVFTQFQQFIGTPAYISPEQAEMSGLDIDTRADIYSLGVLLYELLVGQTPFDAKEMMKGGLDALRQIIREKEPLRPSTKLNTLPGDARTTAGKRRQTEAGKLVHQLQGDLDWIVMKCLEKDRTRRYDTANGLAADLKRHLANEPVVARPPSAAYRFQKAWQRNKLVLTAGAVVAAALVVGIGVSTWQAFVATRATKAESEQRVAAQMAQTKAEAAQASEAEQRSKAEAEKLSAQRHLYRANMNLAQQAWEQNNMARLRQLLEETQTSLDRGFEWYYWQRQTHQAEKTLRGHSDWITSAAFSPDGQRIVTGSVDQTAKVWETASGRELLTLKGHSAQIYSVAFSPDGQRIVTGSYDYTAKVWAAASGRELLTLTGRGAGIRSAAFSPDGQRIVTGNFDKTATVWDAASGREQRTLTGHRDAIRFVAFSPDGQRIVTGSDDQTARVWETASGRELLTLKGHTAQIWAAAFSPDGQRIVTGSWDQTAKVWAAASGRELLTLTGHTSWILSAAFSPDGQRIVTGSFDRTAKVWEAASGRERLMLKGHSAQIYSVAFSADSRRILTGSGDQTAKVWEVANVREWLTFNGHSAPIHSVAISPDGRRIVSGSVDQTAKVWEADSGHELLTLKGHSGGINAVTFSADGQRIVTGSADQTAKVWEAASGRELLTLHGHRAPIWSVAFSPDGQRIASGSDDQTARVWAAANGSELLTLHGHHAPIWSVAFSPDSQRIVTGSDDQTAKVWEAASGRELLTLKGRSGGVRSVVFSPDGQRIVTGNFDKTATLWEAASGRELLTFRGHSGGINAVAFSADGQRIVTGSGDQTAKVWEMASGRELLTLTGHSDGIRSVAFAPDGQRIVAGSLDQTAKVWAAARAAEVAVWQAEEWAAEQQLAAARDERAARQERQRIARAQDEGAIKRWLILAPIALVSGQSVAEGLSAEQIEGEGRLRPKAGEGTVVGNGEMKWQELALEDYVINFNGILRQTTARGVAYAVCYIHSEAGQRGLQLLVGSDDAAKVYLNGKPVHQYPFEHRFVADQDRVPDIALNAGLNVVVFKVVNKDFFWQGSIRFTDAKGDPVKGIQVTLDPDAMKQK